MNATATFNTGDLVTLDPAHFPGLTGRVFQIEKVPAGARGVNYIAQPVDGIGRGVKAPAYCFTAYDPDAPAVPVALPDYTPAPSPGTVVRVTGIAKIDPNTLYVVLGEARQINHTKLVKMGGDNGRYWPRIPTARLTVLSLTEVAEHLVASL